MGSEPSILPLDGTTHRGRLRLWTVTSVSDLLHRLEQVAARICYGLHARRVQPSTILQLVLRVETEKVGRALSVIGSRHFLRLIEHEVGGASSAEYLIVELARGDEGPLKTPHKMLYFSGNA
jgi:hypothetical protein